VDRIAAIQAFVRVVEAGSFARAAQRLRSSNLVDFAPDRRARAASGRFVLRRGIDKRLKKYERSLLFQPRTCR